MPNELELEDLTPEQRELILDLTKLCHDVGMIIEPTHFNDMEDTAIGLYRMDWLGPAKSRTGIYPYLGDFSKLGKIPNYALKLERAIYLAIGDKVFAKVLKPFMIRLVYLFDRIPTEQFRQKCPNLFSQQFMQKLYNCIESMRNKMIRALPTDEWKVTRLDDLADKLLLKAFGSTDNVGSIVRRNVRVAAEFFDKYEVCFSDGLPDVGAWANKLRGIDLHAHDGIYISTVKADHQLAQFVKVFSKPTEKTLPLGNLRVKERMAPDLNYYEIGEWFTEAKNRVTHRNLGVSAGGKSVVDNSGEMVSTSRIRLLFNVKGEVEVLRTKAASVTDYWTPGRDQATSAIHHKEVSRGKNADSTLINQYTTTKGEMVNGGGDQIFLPHGYLKVTLAGGQ